MAARRFSSDGREKAGHKATMNNNYLLRTSAGGKCTPWVHLYSVGSVSRFLGIDKQDAYFSKSER
jgi:hypothetical protein